jgi:tRNA pseudouridine38-40 synthase
MGGRFRLDVAFDGTGFRGWQVQPDRHTVQGELARALTQLGECAVPTGAGRTDAGVHALLLPTHADLERDWSDAELARALGSLLSPEISLLRAGRVEDSFHARFSASSRTYHYVLGVEHNPFFHFRRWSPGGLPEADWAREELADVIGEHDFSSFTKSGSSSGTPRAQVLAADWLEFPDGAILTVTADHFLYGMVRALTGVVVRGYQDGADRGHLQKILKRRDRAAAVEAAPAAGLYLTDVRYPGEPEGADRTGTVLKIAGLGIPSPFPGSRKKKMANENA